MPASSAKVPAASVMGVSAAYVGCTVWPSRRASARPNPSLPVAGTESPPVAMMTASTSSGASSASSTRHPPSVATMSRTNVSIRSVAPLRRASASRPSRTSRALCEVGKTFSSSGSSESGTPTSSSKNRRCSASGHERMMRRKVLGDESVTKRCSSTRKGSTLHRPPPLMRILRPPSLQRSMSVTCAPAAAAKIAAIVPAAPAPITATRRLIGRSASRMLLGHTWSRKRTPK